MRLRIISGSWIHRDPGVHCTERASCQCQEDLTLPNPRSRSWTYPTSSHMNDAPLESTSPVFQPHNLPPSRAPCSLVSLPHHWSPFSAPPPSPGLKCSSASKPHSGPLSSGVHFRGLLQVSTSSPRNENPIHVLIVPEWPFLRTPGLFNRLLSISDGTQRTLMSKGRLKLF